MLLGGVARIPRRAIQQSLSPSSYSQSLLLNALVIIIAAHPRFVRMTEVSSFEDLLLLSAPLDQTAHNLVSWSVQEVSR